jgi:hypothetical protein
MRYSCHLLASELDIIQRYMNQEFEVACSEIGNADGPSGAAVTLITSVQAGLTTC